jgi:hypothetical protein
MEIWRRTGISVSDLKSKGGMSMNELVALGVHLNLSREHNMRLPQHGRCFVHEQNEGIPLPHEIHSQRPEFVHFVAFK